MAHKNRAARTDLGLRQRVWTGEIQAVLRGRQRREMGWGAQALREKESAATLKHKRWQALERERSPTERSLAESLRRRVRGLS